MIKPSEEKESSKKKTDPETNLCVANERTQKVKGIIEYRENRNPPPFEKTQLKIANKTNQSQILKLHLNTMIRWFFQLILNVRLVKFAEIKKILEAKVFKQLNF